MPIGGPGSKAPGDAATRDAPPLAPAGVIKRDGTEVPFDAGRIRSAIQRAGAATAEFGAEVARALAAEVVKVLGHRFNGGSPAVEQIQDVVEQVLISADYRATARAYIVYREQHARLRQDNRTLLDVAASVNDYLRRTDWRVTENANLGYSLGGLVLSCSGRMIANYWLDHVYAPEINRAHRDGDLHIHDLDMLAAYCAGWSLRMLLEEGFNGVPGRIESTPPKHLQSAIGQIVNFFGTMQNEWAGAQAFSSFDTYLAPFVRKDGLSFAEVKQPIQELVFNLNVPSRWGTQTPFTNLAFDWVCPEDLRGDVPVIGGEEMAFTYGDLHDEMDLVNRAFIDVMTEGDAKGRVFTFPIPTYNITTDFPWDSANADSLFEMTAKYGLPYFQNFINSELEPHLVRSLCCRLQLDLRELLKRGNGLFGSAEQTGSIGVVTINCARLGHLYKGDEAALYARLDELMDWSRDSLEVKRKVIQRHMDAGLFPYSKRYLGTLRNHFATIGVIGANEMIRNFTADHEDISTPFGQAMAARLLDRMRERLIEFQEETGHMYNLEATPAEGATYRLARRDQVHCRGILQAGTPARPYYTNSTQLPVGFTDDPFEALELQDGLQTRYTGGTVLHLYMNERISSGAVCKKLVRRILESYRLPYLTVTPTFSICPRHGYLAGEHELCPLCDAELLAAKRAERPRPRGRGEAAAPPASRSVTVADLHTRQRCEVWTRVVGYHRPVSQFHPGKRSEHEGRLPFREERAHGHL